MSVSPPCLQQPTAAHQHVEEDQGAGEQAGQCVCPSNDAVPSCASCMGPASPQKLQLWSGIECLPAAPPPGEGGL